jgi:hypothetical protein
MRERAIKQGRWTDRTARQDRLWAEFHWVLDGEVGEDPVGQRRAYEEEENAFVWRERDYEERESKPGEYF